MYGARSTSSLPHPFTSINTITATTTIRSRTTDNQRPTDWITLDKAESETGTQYEHTETSGDGNHSRELV